MFDASSIIVSLSRFDVYVLLTQVFICLVMLITCTNFGCRLLCSLTRVVVVFTLSVFDVAVLVDALGSGVYRCASMYGAAYGAL